MAKSEKGTRPLFPVAIAMGSNLGNRRGHLEYAINALARDLTDLKHSQFVETDPVGVAPGQPAYLNAAVVGSTNLSPRALLDRLRQIEKERGRERPFPMAPRTLDLDQILYSDQIVEQEGLSIPHPRFREREFVLAPLAEIAPDMIDPVTRSTVDELLSELRRRSG